MGARYANNQAGIFGISDGRRCRMGTRDPSKTDSDDLQGTGGDDIPNVPFRFRIRHPMPCPPPHSWSHICCTITVFPHICAFPVIVSLLDTYLGGTWMLPHLEHLCAAGSIQHQGGRLRRRVERTCAQIGANQLLADGAIGDGNEKSKELGPMEM